MNVGLSSALQQAPSAPPCCSNHLEQRQRLEQQQQPSCTCTTEPFRCAAQALPLACRVSGRVSCGAPSPPHKLNARSAPLENLLQSAGCSHTWDSSEDSHDLVQPGAASLSPHSHQRKQGCRRQPSGCSDTTGTQGEGAAGVGVAAAIGLPSSDPAPAVSAPAPAH